MNKGYTQTTDNVTNIKSQKYHLLKQPEVEVTGGRTLPWLKSKKHGKCNCWGCYGLATYSL